MQRAIFIGFIISLAGCSQTMVRSTVDSYGESRLRSTTPLYFVKDGLTLLEKQASGACEEAARSSFIPVSNTPCRDCVQVGFNARLTGTQQMIENSSSFQTSWGTFASTSAMGVGYATSPGVTVIDETGREVHLRFYRDTPQKPLREIQVRSVGAKNSFTAVAYEMCQAAFQDYPRNLSGKLYEVKLRESSKE